MSVEYFERLADFCVRASQSPWVFIPLVASLFMGCVYCMARSGGWEE